MDRREESGPQSPLPPTVPSRTAGRVLAPRPTVAPPRPVPVRRPERPLGAGASKPAATPATFDAPPFDAVECDQICLRGEPVGLALSLGDRLQFFTTLEALTDLDGERFADRASLLAQVRSRMGGA